MDQIKNETTYSTTPLAVESYATCNAHDWEKGENSSHTLRATMMQIAFIVSGAFCALLAAQALPSAIPLYLRSATCAGILQSALVLVKNFLENWTREMSPSSTPALPEKPKEISVLLPVDKPRSIIEPRWDLFAEYVQMHCKGCDPLQAKARACEGIQLIQQLHSGKHVAEKATAGKLADVCWGLMACAASKKEGFLEGTFDIGDPDHRLFHFFQPILYPRLSSHYNARIVATEGGYGHFGCDFEIGNLPSGKRTVMMGRIQTRDNSARTYIKMENWGANCNFITDKDALWRSNHLLGHTAEFVVSQCQRKVPSMFGDVGDGTHMRKEHMLPSDKKRCQELLATISTILGPSSTKDVDLDGYGLQDAVPVFEKALQDVCMQQERSLYQEIHSFLEDLRERYDNLQYRKGNEVSLNSTAIIELNAQFPLQLVDDADGFTHIVISEQ